MTSLGFAGVTRGWRGWWEGERGHGGPVGGVGYGGAVGARDVGIGFWSQGAGVVRLSCTGARNSIFYKCLALHALFRDAHLRYHPQGEGWVGHIGQVNEIDTFGWHDSAPATHF